ncbi:TPA: DUF550 domain-containing protein [Salmonella enterica]|nr:DUF550 domain-containing protein [Salmonella enterica]
MEFAITQSAFTSIRDGLNEELELARIALAALTAEPVLYAAEETLAYANMGEIHLTCLSEPMGDAVIPLYTDSPVSERERIRREHAEWSDKTFGDVGPVGPLKHLSKEAMEAAADPSDPLEWADMQFLLWDAQRRMGLSDEFITRAMVEKLAINKSRQWPEPKDGEPRLHIKEQPVPVVPDDISGIIERFQYQADHLSEWHHIDEHSCKVNRRDLMTALEFMDSCRAAMLQGVEPVSNHDELALYYLQGQKDGLEWAAQLAEANHPLTGDWLYDDPLELAKAIRKGPDMPEFAGSSPVTQDGWISCSERMPAQDDWVLIYSKHGEYLAGQVQGEYVELNDGTLSWLGSALHWMLLPEPPQQEVK